MNRWPSTNTVGVPKPEPGSVRAFCVSMNTQGAYVGHVPVCEAPSVSA